MGQTTPPATWKFHAYSYFRYYIIEFIREGWQEVNSRQREPRAGRCYSAQDSRIIAWSRRRSGK